MRKSLGRLGYPISDKLDLAVKRRGGKGGREGAAAASGDRHEHPTLWVGSKVPARRTRLSDLLQAIRTSQQVSGSGSPKEWGMAESGSSSEAEGAGCQQSCPRI